MVWNEYLRAYLHPCPWHSYRLLLFLLYFFSSLSRVILQKWRNMQQRDCSLLQVRIAVVFLISALIFESYWGMPINAIPTVVDPYKPKLTVPDLIPWTSSSQPVLKSNDYFKFLILLALSAKSPLCKLNPYIYFQAVSKDWQASSSSSHPLLISFQVLFKVLVFIFKVLQGLGTAYVKSTSPCMFPCGNFILPSKVCSQCLFYLKCILQWSRLVLLQWLPDVCETASWNSVGASTLQAS